MGGRRPLGPVRTRAGFWVRRTVEGAAPGRAVSCRKTVRTRVPDTPQTLSYPCHAFGQDGRSRRPPPPALSPGKGHWHSEREICKGIHSVVDLEQRGVTCEVTQVPAEGRKKTGVSLLPELGPQQSGSWEQTSESYLCFCALSSIPGIRALLGLCWKRCIGGSGVGLVLCLKLTRDRALGQAWEPGKGSWRVCVSQPRLARGAADRSLSRVAESASGLPA